MLVSSEWCSEHETSLNLHEAHTIFFSARKSTEGQQSKLVRSDTFLEESLISSLGPGVDIRREKCFSLSGVYSDLAKGTGWKQKQNWNASRDKFLFSLFLYETCLNSLWVHSTGMEGMSTPHHCCVLLKLQLYGHQFWPQNTFRTACRTILLKLNEPRL